jgi:hypothetical protein
MSDYTLRSTNDDGTISKVELTPEQAFDLGAKKPIAYFRRDERILMDGDGTITQRHSAIPPPLDEAA